MEDEKAKQNDEVTHRLAKAGSCYYLKVLEDTRKRLFNGDTELRPSSGSLNHGGRAQQELLPQSEVLEYLCWQRCHRKQRLRGVKYPGFSLPPALQSSPTDSH